MNIGIRHFFVSCVCIVDKGIIDPVKIASEQIIKVSMRPGMSGNVILVNAKSAEILARITWQINK